MPGGAKRPTSLWANGLRLRTAEIDAASVRRVVFRSGTRVTISCLNLAQEPGRFDAGFFNSYAPDWPLPIDEVPSSLAEGDGQRPAIR